MPTILEIETQADVAAASADLIELGNDARAMGADLSAAGDDARKMGTDLTGVADGSDELASKSSQATGALGALAGGLEAVGLEQYAAGLQAAAIGTDVMSGAGDALNLIADTAAGQWLVNTARTVAHTVATGAQTVATGAQTAAQTALNAVMAANPILLVVLAVAALTAGLILAYQKSETFRSIVDGAFTRAKEVVGAAAGAVENIVGWITNLPETARDAAGDVARYVGDMFEPVNDAIGWFSDLISDLETDPQRIAASVAGFFGDMFAPISTAIGWVNELIEKLKNIDLPDLPFGRSSASSTVPAAAAPTPVNITVQAAPTDLDAAMRTLVAALTDYFARQGMTLSIVNPAA